MSEYQDGPIRGLPGRLPEGEKILWQGSPCWRSLARRAYHVPLVGSYLAILLVWAAISSANERSLAEAALSTALLLALALAALSILALLAWLTARTTIYTITNRRVAMQIGIALPVTLNIPFRIVEAAGFRANADRTGDIPLSLAPDGRIAYLVLWPHARPWLVSRPEPMLRAVPEARGVAEILARAVAAYAAENGAPAPVRSVAAARPEAMPAHARAA